MDPTTQALLGLRQYGSDDPVNGIVPPSPNPAHVTPQQLEIMQRVGQPIWDAGSKIMGAIASDPVVRYQTAMHQALGTVLGDKAKELYNTVTYPATHAYPPSFSDSSDPRTQGAIGNALTVAQRLISPAGAFRPKPGVVGSGMGGVGPSEAPSDVVGPLMQKAPWNAPSVDPAGILAYHGSPHDFNAFDMSKVGTGEGAQVFGHGLYTAGREGVARSYRDTLSRPDAVENSPRFIHSDPAMNGQMYLFDNGHMGLTIRNRLQRIVPHDSVATPEHIAKAIADEREAIANTKGPMRDFNSKGLDAFEQELKSSGAQFVNPKKAGHMYEVNIKHDPEHMLDWDKPINEQPEVFKKLRDQGWISDHEVEMRKEWASRVKNNRPEDALLDWYHDLEAEKIRALKADDVHAENAVQKKIDVMMGWWNQQIANPRQRIAPDVYPTGEDFYKHMTDQHDTPQGASEALKEMGIPGIRYLDQGSRGAGEGSRNYVSFDDKSMEILRKYGIAGLLSAGTAGGAAVNNLRNYVGGLPEEDNKRMLQLLQQGGT